MGDRPAATDGDSFIEPADASHIVVEGDSPLHLPGSRAAAEREHDLVTKTIGFECMSGEWLESTWTGIPADDFAVDAGMADSTTHLRIASRDGFVACAPVTALDGALVAYAGVDEPESDFPRFVSPTVKGPRAVKNVARFEPVALAPDEDPEDYEERPMD